MSQRTDIDFVCRTLTGSGPLLILTHKNPDGDTLGAGFSLWRALSKLGIKSRVEVADNAPRKYSAIKEFYDEAEKDDFEPSAVVSVDIAGASLLTERSLRYRDDVLLAIDHHRTHQDFAKYLFLDASSESCCGIIARVIDRLGVEWDDYIAKCIYTGLSTDTGCFRYANTTSESLKLAARTYGYNIDAKSLNYVYFEEKSVAHIKLEELALNGVQMYADGRIAVMTLTLDMMRAAGADSDDIEGITPIPRQIEGVRVGVTLRELENGSWKGSLRSNGDPDCSAICRNLGGGGHPGAAGFECSGTISDIKKLILAEIYPHL
ncbi:MAG: DHH family phosphoesterase [Oscillospiraceae bacterium]|jgi:phosphoesterase RecJ-like protein